MLTWRESIVEALLALGGRGAYDEIYAEVAARRATLPPSWQAIVRRTIQQASSDSLAHVVGNGDLFFSVAGLGHGQWGLRGADAGALGSDAVAENPGSAQGYVADSVVRRAIEMHAVRRAIDYYSGLGASNIEEVGKPYDLRLTLAGDETHVEVKGSTSALNQITLTVNEVTHANDWARTDLYVMDLIELTTDDTGQVDTRGGRERVWRGWHPSVASLTATVYRHELPDPS